ncbi:hypothetical protein F511_09647 [Dorcoceras hygrometricum]|uniref:Uncharacterized protein n=1 Tax=Dorcoceras hygrometricum TaxID=472368 RepID=A0A2Z7D8W4_9LAMI|nr:hypothetical protein F511_09647 [Dorcoceras hygrometricum]
MNQKPDDDDAKVNEPTSEPAVADIVYEEPSNADEVDDIIEKVLADTAQIIVDEEDQVVRTSGEGNQPAGTAEERHWFDLPYDDLIARWDAERPVVTASDTDEDIETMDVGAAGGDQQIDDSYFAKEELVLSWAEAESTGVALQRKMYILLKYRAVLVRKYLDGWILNFVPGEGDSAVHLKFIDMLSDLLSFVLEELKQQAVAHRIRWTRPCCSILFEGRLTSHRDIPAYTIFEVSGQRQYDDTLPLIAQNTVSVAPIVQLIDEHSSSDSTSDDISMDFADQDTAAVASISLPAAPIPDVTKALNQLRASIDQIRERDDGGAKHKDTLLLHLHDFEKQVIARLDAQDRLGTQIVTTGIDVIDVRRVVRETHQELNAKINSLDEQVAATRHDLLDFSAQAQHVGDPDPSPGEAAEEQRITGRRSIQNLDNSIIVIHRFTPIRSTTRSETPSSGCTRSADEISTNGFSSLNWQETNFRRRSATAACSREGGGGFGA